MTLRLLLSLAALLLFYMGMDASLLESTAVGISTYAFLRFVHSISRRIALPECIQFIAALEILLVPAITYATFPASMPIDSRQYFLYALPAYTAFAVGLNWSARRESDRSHRLAIQTVRTYLRGDTSASLALLLIGLVGFVIRTLFPSTPALFSTLPAYCLFTSAFYTYYARSPFRGLIIGTVGAVLLLYTVREGMFGDLFFWLTLSTLLVTAGRNRPLTMQLKTLTVGSALTLLMLIQSVKSEYRRNTWGHYRGERNGDAALLTDLLTDRLANPDKILNVGQVYLSFVRFNQGLMIGSAMTKVPQHEAYAGGEVLLSLVYPLVPRLLWPDKPQTGGYENIRRFTSLPQFENTSINLSPLGEGYVNFGYGGILFALCYGGLLGFVFQYIFRRAEVVPTLILWLPVLFIGCLTMETDLLSTWGSLLTNGIFIWLLYGSLARIGIQL